MSEPYNEPCGGCGEENPDKRCLGCMHEMPTRSPPMTETAKLEALIVGQLFADLRDRRFLKWLFSANPTLIGTFENGGGELRSLDDDVQQEIRDEWEAIISRALSASRPAVKGLEWIGDEAVTPFGKYRVERTDDGYALSFEFEELVHIGFNSVGAFESPRDKAVSYAQPHFEQRILSSLSPPEEE